MEFFSLLIYSFSLGVGEAGEDGFVVNFFPPLGR